jgi:hypothetical protein
LWISICFWCAGLFVGHCVFKFNGENTLYLCRDQICSVQRSIQFPSVGGKSAGVSPFDYCQSASGRLNNVSKEAKLENDLSACMGFTF